MEWDVRGIVHILKSCTSAGVTKFKLDQLEITFLEKQVTLRPVQETTGTGFEQVTFRPVSEEDELRIQEMQHEELLISDPLAYENNALGENTSD